MAKPKYRPSLSEQEVDYILSLARNEYLTGEHNVNTTSVIAKFEVLKAKINSNAIKPSHIESGNKTLLDKLGGTPESTSFTKEQKWEQSYIKYQDNPKNCSIKEIEEAKEHMYLHGLMSEEEKERFENDIDLFLKGDENV
jgi:hypothetical protein